MRHNTGIHPPVHKLTQTQIKSGNKASLDNNIVCSSGRISICLLAAVLLIAVMGAGVSVCCGNGTNLIVCYVTAPGIVQHIVGDPLGRNEELS